MVGAKTLLLDEDSCATNLLIRDQRMQALIEAEPITPLVAKACQITIYFDTVKLTTACLGSIVI